MLVYSVIYFLLAIYVERLNPGEFGVSQPWNYLWKRSHSKSSILRRGTNGSDDGYAKTRNSSAHGNHWLELSRSDRQKTAAMSIDHLNKVIISFLQQLSLITSLFRNSANSLLSLIFRSTSTKVKCVHCQDTMVQEKQQQHSFSLVWRIYKRDSSMEITLICL